LGSPPAEGDTTASVPPGEPVREQPAAGGEIATNTTSSTEPESAVANAARLISILLDANQPLEARIAAAKTLAELGTDEAIAALKTALAASNPDALRVAIAEALGKCPHPDSQNILIGLLSDTSRNVVKAAIHALARQDSPKALAVLNQLLGDSLKSADVRSEAALALASMSQPGAIEALTHAVVLMDDEDAATQILNELGQGSIDKLLPFFQNYLLAPNVSTDLKVTAIEALSQAEGEVGPFLSACLDNADPQLRAAAAWALSDTENPGDIS
jgi:HEAT repeat protein